MDSIKQSTKTRQQHKKKATERFRKHTQEHDNEFDENEYSHTLFSIDDIFAGAWRDVIEKEVADDDDDDESAASS